MKLATSVDVRKSDTEGYVTLAAGSEPPAWAVPLITNPKAWEGGELPTATVEEADTGAENGEGPVEDSKPAGNASEEVWRDYALKHGYTEAELEGKKRDDLRDLFN